MNLILARRPNTYTGSLLDRAVHRREDPEWIAARLAAPESLFVPLSQARNLIDDQDPAAPIAVFLSAAIAGPFCTADPTGPFAWAFLGLLDGRAIFAFDLGPGDPAVLLPGLPGRFIDLRTVPGLLAGGEAALLAHARGLMHWRARHRYCGVCGAHCHATAAGNVVRCPSCDIEHFPRTDPAVIMLVTDGTRALLGHSHRFPRTMMYSTLAGFVEPGESLEEAVAREVGEETSVRVGRVQYHSSQPWPFPGSIMLGFYAEALTTDIVLQTEELRDARWFTRAEIAAHESLGFNLPRLDSIARRLIEDWMADG